MKNEKIKLFGLFSFEGAVFFGTTQYLQVSVEDIFFSKVPPFAKDIPKFCTNDILLRDVVNNPTFNSNKNTFVSVLNVSEKISTNALIMLLKSIYKNVGLYSCIVMSFNKDEYDYLTMQKIFEICGFLIYEKNEFMTKTTTCVLGVKMK